MANDPIWPIDDPAVDVVALAHEASRLADDDPAALTDLHLRAWATLDALGVHAIARKRDAARADAERRQREAVAAANQPAPGPTAAPLLRPSSPRDMDVADWLKVNARAGTPIWLSTVLFDGVRQLGKFVEDMDAKNVERNATIKTLRDDIKVLQRSYTDLQQKYASLEKQLATEARLAALESQLVDAREKARR